MIALNTNALLSYLKENGFTPQLHPDAQQFFILLQIDEHEIPVFFIIRPETHLLQLISYIPFEVRKEAVSELARLLHLFNQQIDMPGFGMDETQLLLFYRSVLPCPSGQVDPNLIDMYLGTARIAIETFIKPIALVASGHTSLDALLKGETNAPTPDLL